MFAQLNKFLNYTSIFLKPHMWNIDNRCVKKYGNRVKMRNNI